MSTVGRVRTTFSFRDYDLSRSSHLVAHSTDRLRSVPGVLETWSNMSEAESVLDRHVHCSSQEERDSFDSFVVTEQKKPSGVRESISLRDRLSSYSLRRGLRNSLAYRKLPCSRNIWLIYLMFFLYGVAEFSTTLLLFFLLHAYNKLNPPQTVAVYLGTRFLVYTAFPVVGFLADTFFGRYKVILTSFYTSLFGTVALAIGFSTSLDPELDPHHNHSFISQEAWSTRTILFLILFLNFIWIGFTGIRVNLIPFGVDQLPEASSGELSSYFHWYYWWLYAGYLVASVFLPFIYQNTALGFVFLFLALCFTGSILLLVLWHDDFVIQPHIGNPFKLVYRVTRTALKSKRPQFLSAFDIGRPHLSRFDLTMDIRGGSFTVEQVEDVKTFYRILLILLSFFGYFAVSSQLQSTYLLEGMRMVVPQGCTNSECPFLGMVTINEFFNSSTIILDCQLWKVPASLWLGIANILPILLLIPICDRLIYPCLKSPMLRRMAAGKVFIFLSISVAITVEVLRQHQLINAFNEAKDGNTSIIVNAIPFHGDTTIRFHVASPMSIGWILPQYFLFAFAEVLASITAVEFIYAQSPAVMKGLLLGLLFGTEGVAMGVAAFLIFLQGQAKKFSFFSFFGNSDHYVKELIECVSDRRKYCTDSPLFSYILVSIIVVLSVVFFCWAAFKYQFRKRDPDPYNPNF